mmetsp:Transcript_27063/g.64288  ORF Transcript_27063/g.64288 Transcript_27063/m.64288 type:complete len:264 (-) Transcript_27063:35-826(-)
MPRAEEPERRTKEAAEREEETHEESWRQPEERLRVLASQRIPTAFITGSPHLRPTSPTARPTVMGGEDGDVEEEGGGGKSEAEREREGREMRRGVGSLAMAARTRRICTRTSRSRSPVIRSGILPYAATLRRVGPSSNASMGVFGFGVPAHVCRERTMSYTSCAVTWWMLTSRGARSSPRRGGVAGSRHRLNRTMYSRDPPSLARAPELGSRAADEGSLSWRYPIARRPWPRSRRSASLAATLSKKAPPPPLSSAGAATVEEI